MHDQSRRLVDGQQVFVFVEHIEGNDFGGRTTARLRRFETDAKLIAGLHPPRRSRRRLAVDQHVAGIDPFLNPIAGDAPLVAEVAVEHEVHPHARIAAVESEDAPRWRHAPV